MLTYLLFMKKVVEKFDTVEERRNNVINNELQIFLKITGN